MPDYTTVERVLDILPAVGSLTSITSGHLATFIEDAEADINAMIANQYAVPVSGTPPLLRSIATDLACYRVLSRRVFTQERLKDSVWPDRYKEADERLQKIAEGKIALVNSSGTLIATSAARAEVWSDTMDYHPTFHEGPDTSHIVDEDKLDDIAEERDIGTFRDRIA